MDRNEVVLLGSAVQRIITAGELLGLAGASAGCKATQKNDYPITVMRGHSVSEIILSDDEIDYTGIENPSVMVALAPEGVSRRKKMFAGLSKESIIIKAAGVELAPCQAAVIAVDFKSKKIRSQDYALAALAVLAQQDRILNMDMFHSALKHRFNMPTYETVLSVVEKAVT
jgi:Pyruvate/2-oxoacid:ferredoxin oxidoreductase gamma subunit